MFMFVDTKTPLKFHISFKDIVAKFGRIIEEEEFSKNTTASEFDSSTYSFKFFISEKDK